MVSVDQNPCPPRYRDPVWVSAGGMGTLYRAIDGVLNRPVAIKLLAERLAADEEGPQAAFRRESRRFPRRQAVGRAEHRHDLRHRRVAGPALHRHGIPRRGHARAALARRAPPAGESAALDRSKAGSRARCGARSWSCAPRRQARESAVRRPGPGEGRRLRHCDSRRPRLAGPRRGRFSERSAISRPNRRRVCRSLRPPTSTRSASSHSRCSREGGPSTAIRPQRRLPRMSTSARPPLMRRTPSVAAGGRRGVR